MKSRKVLVTSRSFGSGLMDTEKMLLDAGLTVVRRGSTHQLSELKDDLADVEAWIAGTGMITAAHLDLAPKLKVIARYGVGYDAVDLNAAAARGIIVTNTPGANSESVADLALALLLGGLRTTSQGDTAVRKGDWGVIRGREIKGSRIGIAGFGRIGRALAERIVALGGTVLAYDPFLDSSAEVPSGCSVAGSFAELSACDAVSLHVPGGQCLIDQAWLDQAQNVVLINTARADLVDENAVAAALGSASLAAYGADTLDGEGRDSSASPLLDPMLRGRVTVTPHLGAQTVQAVDRMGAGAVQNTIQVLRGLDPLNPVFETRNPS